VVINGRLASGTHTASRYINAPESGIKLVLLCMKTT